MPYLQIVAYFETYLSALCNCSEPNALTILITMECATDGMYVSAYQVTTTKSKAILGSAPNITVNVYNMRDSNGVLCEGSSCATNTDASVTYAGAAGAISPVGCSGGTCLGITLTMPVLSLVGTFSVEVSSNGESATFDFSVFDFECETYCQDKTSADVAMILNHVRCLIRCCSCAFSALSIHFAHSPCRCFNSTSDSDSTCSSLHCMFVSMHQSYEQGACNNTLAM